MTAQANGRAGVRACGRAGWPGTSGASARLCVGALVLLAACGGGPPPAPPAPAVDTAAVRARADSLAAAARRDSLALLTARRDSAVARARADSLVRAAADRAREDSVRAEVLRDTVDSAPTPASGLDAARAEALARAIHFDYDRADIRPDDLAPLEQKLAVLRAFPQLELQIEGHCDERGPDEYNLALGNRRAAAVKRWFVEHGVPDARLNIVSYGEERPADPRATDEAWAANRRAEFRVTRGAT